MQEEMRFFIVQVLTQPLLLGRIYSVGLTILRRIADYFVQNRRFFLQESQIFCTFAAAKVWMPSRCALQRKKWVQVQSVAQNDIIN